MVRPLAIGIALLALSCTERRAQVAVQSSLNAMAEGVNGAYRVALSEQDSAGEQARAQARASNPATVEEYMTRYDAIMGAWDELADALEAATASLLLGQSAVDLWISGQGLPDDWGQFCEDVETSLERVIELLETCGVDVPSGLAPALEHASTVCVVAGEYFSPGEE